MNTLFLDVTWIDVYKMAHGRTILPFVKVSSYFDSDVFQSLVVNNEHHIFDGVYCNISINDTNPIHGEIVHNLQNTF